MQATDTPPKDLDEVLIAGLRAHAVATNGPTDWRTLAVPLHMGGKLVGGLSGRTVNGMLVIEMLVVPEGMRGQGIGSKLLAEAEAEAVRRGCTAAVLNTMNFQAPAFYARLGWEEFGRIVGGRGVERVYFRKALRLPG